jgi:hypothetical protein
MDCHIYKLEIICRKLLTILLIKLYLQRPEETLRAPGFKGSRVAGFLDNWHMKMARSALCTDRLYRPVDISGTHFFWKPNRAQNHNDSGRIDSMKNGMTSSRIGSRNLAAVASSSFATAFTTNVEKSF